MAKLFMRDGLTLLVHGYSSVVLSILAAAAQKGIKCKVIVTEAQPEASG